MTNKSSFSAERIAEKLIESGYIDAARMERALQESRRSGIPLIEVLEMMTSRAVPPAMLRQYKKQQLFQLKIVYGVEVIDLDLEEISISTIAELIKTLVPIDLCRRYKFLPIIKYDRPPRVLFAMVDPDNCEAQDDLKRILRPQNLELQRRVITLEDYEILLKKYLDQKSNKDQQTTEADQASFRQFDPSEFNDTFDDMISDLEEDLGRLDQYDINTSPVIKLVNVILAKGLTHQASEIHIEPQKEDLRIRFRQDGILKEAFDPLSKKLVPAIISRLKIMADLNITISKVPQNGIIRRVFEGHKVEFRVNIIPTRYGEKICMRVLDHKGSPPRQLNQLITNTQSLEILRKLLNQPSGLILVTGTGGSGKTTTLYSMLREKNASHLNISTIEDPIEYELSGVNQAEVISTSGATFVTMLNAFMRQGVDVMMVGETRDLETAKAAIEMALTGSLVMTAIHANDAVSAITRLEEMGVESWQISNSLIGVCAQRLIRRVCDSCKIAYQPTIERLNQLGLLSNQKGLVTFYKANELQNQAGDSTRQKGNLCPNCQGLGYKGCIGVYEVMKITNNLRSLIKQNAASEMIKNAAIEEGMITLLEEGLNLVKAGLTTLEEIERLSLMATD